MKKALETESTGHGGKRAGAGRKLQQGPDTVFPDAHAYLTAVACGQVAGDSLRIQAAKAVLNAKARTDAKSSNDFGLDFDRWPIAGS